MLIQFQDNSIPKNISDKANSFIQQWAAISPEEKIPLKSDLNPMAFKDFISNIILYQKLEDQEVIIKLISAQYTDLVDIDFTGVNISKVFFDHDKTIFMQAVQEMKSNQCGLYQTIRHEYDGNDEFAVDIFSIVLPLRDPNGELSHWIGLLEPIVNSTSDLKRMEENSNNYKVLYKLHSNIDFIDIGYGKPNSIKYKP